jgi:hypothetical protein
MLQNQNRPATLAGFDCAEKSGSAAADYNHIVFHLERNSTVWNFRGQKQYE